MKKFKKAQSLSINTIIIALLALLVLVLLIAILTGNIKIFTKTTDSCISNGGTCDKFTDNQCNDGYTLHPFGKCEDKNKLCCIPISGKE
ncbi:MAG: hypothetical protein QXE31_05715 [Candidatus Woesearchaeota archaeon]